MRLTDRCCKVHGRLGGCGSACNLIRCGIEELGIHTVNCTQPEGRAKCLPRSRWSSKFYEGRRQIGRSYFDSPGHIFNQKRLTKIECSIS
jgi:hypothetical protein